MRILFRQMPFLFFLAALNVSAGTIENTQHKVLIEYFFQPGCAECEKVDKLIKPAIKERFHGFYEIRDCDIGVRNNFIFLAAYQKKFKIQRNDSVSMVLDGRFFLSGYKEIESGILEKIDEALSMPPPELPSREHPPVKEADMEKTLKDRAARMTLPALIAAGLADGINPCVFSTLIFFVSLLAASGKSNRKILTVGFVFCSACFLSYFALGFGLLRFIKLFSGYKTLQNTLGVVMFFLLLILALLSFRDAFLFWKSEQSSSVILQLPEKLKLLIHKMMKLGLHYRYLIPGTFIVGVLATALESVCTGQVYVPTLVFLARSGIDSSRSLFLLFLYNFMFILPLVFVFAASYSGVRVLKLVEWGKRELVAGKILMGLFFILLAILFIFL